MLLHPVHENTACGLISVVQCVIKVICVCLITLFSIETEDLERPHSPLSTIEAEEPMPKEREKDSNARSKQGKRGKYA